MKEIDAELEILDDDFPEKNSAVELGNRLRAAREAKGLDYKDLTEITRLRPRFLEALERGDWNGLPSQALVRGFIASYARALGLDAAEVIERHSDALPAGKSPFSEITPKKPGSKIKPSVLLTSVLLIAIFFGVFMLWREWAGPRISSERDAAAPAALQTEALSSEAESETIHRKPEPRRPGSPGEETGPPAVTVVEGVADKTASMAPGREVRVAESVPEESSDVEKPTFEEHALEPETRSGEISVPPTVERVEEVERESVKMPLILKAAVKERTWMRISIDGGEPREYIFSPGREPEWEARGMFDLLIGNAGGLALELNGKEIGPLGASGQVVRVRLPEAVE
ncbi:MAG TPA: helix-turn-helix domain-containing protein [Desulfobacteraceae bacterium]|nr:helix-turn-helix domain-containing protein [Desulfobacteraceae bacterium]